MFSMVKFTQITVNIQRLNDELMNGNVNLGKINTTLIFIEHVVGLLRSWLIIGDCPMLYYAHNNQPVLLLTLLKKTNTRTTMKIQGV